jgi:uncharacterized protein YrzB (UPF0473 family)
MKTKAFRHGYGNRKRGTGNITKHGYLILAKNNERKFAHRIIMEKFLGRKLLATEMVHHVNGDKLDNRIENLEIVSKSAHKKIHNDIGEETRFKNIYKFSNTEIYKKYLEYRSSQKVADEVGCSEITIRRILRNMFGKSLREIAKDLGWNYGGYGHLRN